MELLNNKKRIYFDNSATTAVASEVVEAMGPYFTDFFGNASSVHSFGQQAKAAMDKARRQVAALIGAEFNEIVFLSGGTEANNLAIRGITQAYQDKGRHIITSQFEHPAVLNTCASLEKQGWQVTYLPVYENGIVRLEDVKAAMTDQTLLVTLMHANNEIGTIQPIAEIAKFIKEDIRPKRKNIFLHTDAVQTVGKVSLDVKSLGVDMLSISAHKLHAPKGIGALYIRKGVRIASQQTGGHQERDRRAGTENIPAIVAFGCAAELARKNIDTYTRQVEPLRDYLEQQIAKNIPDLVFNGDHNYRLPNIANISFKYVDGEALLIALDLKGVAVSTGAACASGSTEQSHVLVALGLEKDVVRGSLRFSLSRYNTREEVDYLLEVLPAVVEKLRRISPLYQERLKQESLKSQIA
ncbi:MAG: cysteine desulfurase NifS [Blastocatellia bacterium]|nr:cysteine desulfurase NifS [Blastocatellia bacterium]